MRVRWVGDVLRSLYRHRFICISAVCATALGVAGGLEVTRPRPRSLVYLPVDPDTGCGSVSLALIGHWLGAPRTIEELNRLRIQNLLTVALGLFGTRFGW